MFPSKGDSYLTQFFTYPQRYLTGVRLIHTTESDFTLAISQLWSLQLDTFPLYQAVICPVCPHPARSAPYRSLATLCPTLDERKSVFLSLKVIQLCYQQKVFQTGACRTLLMTVYQVKLPLIFLFMSYSRQGAPMHTQSILCVQCLHP